MVYVCYLVQNFNDTDSIKNHIDECLKSIAEMQFYVTELDNPCFDHKKTCENFRTSSLELYKSNSTLKNRIEAFFSNNDDINNILQIITSTTNVLIAKNDTLMKTTSTEEILKLKKEIFPKIDEIKTNYASVRRKLK